MIPNKRAGFCHFLPKNRISSYISPQTISDAGYHLRGQAAAMLQALIEMFLLLSYVFGPNTKSADD